MENEKKKRSPNFTLDEKENLLSIVAKYKGVVECKRTGAFFIKKKKEAWASITKQYNSVCTTGPRDVLMLKHFYNNIKHRARKVSASENKQRYLNEETTDPSSQSVAVVYENQPISVVEDVNISKESPNNENIELESLAYENSIEELKNRWTEEKKNIKKTGGGTFIPTLTEADHQILSILDDQIRPDENPYDEAAEYFGETIEVQILNDCEPNPVPEPKPVPAPKSNAQRKPIKVIPFNKKKNRVLKPDCISKSAESLKKIYFKKKIDLTFYQKKTEMLKFRNEQKKQVLELKKYDLEIKILEKQLEKV